jgi:hypothetical protein
MEKPSPCYSCLNYKSGFSCNAFERIPDIILTGYNDHRSPFPGDGGIQFEKKPDNPQVEENISDAEKSKASLTADYKRNIQIIENGLSTARGILGAASDIEPVVFRKEGVYSNYRGEDVYLNRDITPQAEAFAALIRKPIAVFRDFRLNRETGEITSIEEYIGIVRDREAGHRFYYALIIGASAVKLENVELYLSYLQGNKAKIESILLKTSGMAIFNSMEKGGIN